MGVTGVTAGVAAQGEDRAGPHSLGAVAEPLGTLGPGPAGPGAVGPGRPAAPASGDALWLLPHRDALASHTPLGREEEEMSGGLPPRLSRVP